MQDDRWKAERYDEIVAAGGDDALEKLRAYDELARKAARLDTLDAAASGKLDAFVNGYRGVFGRLQEARRALERVAGAPAGEAPATTPAEATAYRLVFLLGGARTGTTLVGSYLAWAPETHRLPREAGPLLSAFRYRKEAVASSRKFIGKRCDYAADVATRAYVRLFIEAEHAQRQAAALVFRSPALTRHLGELAEIVDFAEAVYLCCLRDPRDACVSLLDWDRRARDAGRPPVLPSDDAAGAAAHFMGFYARMLDPADASAAVAVHFVRYEDAVADPARTVAALASATGLDLSSFDATAPWQDGAVDYTAEAGANHAVTPLYGAAPSDSQVGRYRASLSAGDIARIEDVCGPFMERFGYV